MTRTSAIVIQFFLSLLLLLTGLPALAKADVPVSPSAAAKHVGEFVTVCGQVASAKYASRSRGAPTFLNLGKPYPYQIFTAVIWGKDRMKFAYPPESLDGASICVRGLIRLYRGKPEIIVRDPNAISRSGH